ncbi:MAG TPA: hypothetical protein VGH40_05840 [Roseiarcus sp.]|jgi:hypothetical protein
MLEHQSAARRRRRSIQFATAVAALLALAPAARAQGLFSFFAPSAPSPYDIERRLDRSGYALTGPLKQRGGVWLADVVTAGGRDQQRLVIDAHTGRIIERYRMQPARWRDAPREMDSEESVWGPDSRPPADVDQPPPRDEFARQEDPALGTGAPRTTSTGLGDTADGPKPKPHEARHKSAPLARAPASAHTEASAGAAATAPAATAASPAASAAPHPAKSEPPAAAAAAASPTVTAKSDGASMLPGAAKAPPRAEVTDAKPASKTKPVNDLPVTPLD